MRPELRRHIGVGAGVALGATAVLLLNAPGCETFHAPGPMNTQHETLACTGCHHEAPGTVRQQLQTAAYAGIAIGGEQTPVDIGYRAVTNAECFRCHENPDDRHPVFRFLEPRFAAVRERMHPEHCASCHREHAGVRVTVVEQTYCQHCHEDIALERDPLDVTHRELVATKRWDSCLGCHDYHGNHASKPPRRLQDAIPSARIQMYFDGGPSPYGAPSRRASTPQEVTAL